MDIRDMLRQEVDGTSSVSLPVARFGMRGVELLGCLLSEV
jgi:hypothetical protein